MLIFNDTSVQDQLASLHEKNEFMNNLLSSVSHELRTPLSGIMTQLECAMENITVPEKVKKMHLRPSYDCSRLLLFFVNDIVDFVAEKGNTEMRLDIKPVDIKAIVNDMLKLFQLPSQLKKLKIRARFEEGIPAVINSDKRRIIQVIS